MNRSILFTGHMIDKEDRDVPRFPKSKEFEVRKRIRMKLVDVIKSDKNQFIGIAGGACGGDILFHEVCEEMRISTEIYLALPVIEFKKRSVSFAGKEWDIRFDKLIEKLPVHILPEEIRNKSQDNIWAAANLWMLDHALKEGAKKMTLIALWDYKGGDGNGGTEHMIKLAEERSADVKIIDITKI